MSRRTAAPGGFNQHNAAFRKDFSVNDKPVYILPNTERYRGRMLDNQHRVPYFPLTAFIL